MAHSSSDVSRSEVLAQKLQLLDIELLLGIAHGDIKADYVAQVILARRGRNDSGDLVGTEKAAAAFGIDPRHLEEGSL